MQGPLSLLWASSATESPGRMGSMPGRTAWQPWLSVQSCRPWASVPKTSCQHSLARAACSVPGLQREPAKRAFRFNLAGSADMLLTARERHRKAVSSCIRRWPVLPCTAHGSECPVLADNVESPWAFMSPGAPLSLDRSGSTLSCVVL